MGDIADYIPVGYRNAITRTELAIRTGLDDRQMRDAIKRSPALICNLQDGHGYFRPAAREGTLVRAYLQQEARRSIATNGSVAKCRAWLKAQRRFSTEEG